MMGERHNREFNFIYVKARTWEEYDKALGSDKVAKHFALFYDNTEVQVPLSDTVKVICPLMAGAIPVHAAIGEIGYGERKAAST